MVRAHVAVWLPHLLVHGLVVFLRVRMHCYGWLLMGLEILVGNVGALHGRIRSRSMVSLVAVALCLSSGSVAVSR